MRFSLKFVLRTIPLLCSIYLRVDCSYCRVNNKILMFIIETGLIERSYHVHYSRWYKDAHSTHHLTHGHTTPPDHSWYQLTGVLKWHKVCSCNGHPTHQSWHQPHQCLVWTCDTVPDTEHGGQHQKQYQWIFPSKLVNYEGSAPARNLENDKYEVLRHTRNIRIKNNFHTVPKKY